MSSSPDFSLPYSFRQCPEQLVGDSGFFRFLRGVSPPFVSPPLYLPVTFFRFRVITLNGPFFFYLFRVLSSPETWSPPQPFLVNLARAPDFLFFSQALALFPKRRLFRSTGTGLRSVVPSAFLLRKKIPFDVFPIFFLPWLVKILKLSNPLLLSPVHDYRALKTFSHAVDPPRRKTRSPPPATCFFFSFSTCPSPSGCTSAILCPTNSLPAGTNCSPSFSRRTRSLFFYLGPFILLSFDEILLEEVYSLPHFPQRAFNQHRFSPQPLGPSHHEFFFFHSPATAGFFFFLTSFFSFFLLLGTLKIGTSVLSH